MSQVMKLILKALLLFLAFTLVVSVVAFVLLRHGGLTPGGAAVLLASAVFAVFAIYLALAWRSEIRTRNQMQLPEATVDSEARKRRLLGVRLGKIAILILALGLLNTLRMMRDNPIWPLAVGAAMNVLMIVAVVIPIRRLQRSLK
jgi:membrane associated rhomboid family serine protease